MMQLFCQLKCRYTYLNAQAHDPSHCFTCSLDCQQYLFFGFFIRLRKGSVPLVQHAPAELEVISTVGGSSKQMKERMRDYTAEQCTDRLREILLFAYLRMHKTGKVNNFLKTVVVGGGDEDEMLATMSMWAESKESLLVIRFCWFAARSHSHWRASEHSATGADMEAMRWALSERKCNGKWEEPVRQWQWKHPHQRAPTSSQWSVDTHSQCLWVWDLIWSLHLNFNSIYIISALVGDCLLLSCTTSGNNCIILWLNLIFSFFRSLKCENESAVPPGRCSRQLRLSYSHCQPAHS